MLKQSGPLKKIQQSIGRTLATIPLTPNQWTITSLLLALIAGLAIALTGQLAAGLALFTIAAIFDAIDGAVARARGQVTKMGGFIDGVADRFVEATFLISLMFIPLPTIFIDPKIWLAILVFTGTCMPSFIRAYAEHKGVISKEKAHSLGGICERSERLAIIVLALGAGIFMGMEYFIYGAILAIFLSIVTIIQRLVWIGQPNV